MADLFCGAGGLSKGFLDAGFQLAFGMDRDGAAVQTHNTNLGNHAVCREITEDVDLPDVTVIVGGPPCQGFSSAGLRAQGTSGTAWFPASQR